MGWLIFFFATEVTGWVGRQRCWSCQPHEMNGCRSSSDRCDLANLAKILDLRAGDQNRPLTRNPAQPIENTRIFRYTP